MARTLSRDLRDGVVAAIDGGLSCRAAAARLGVSVSSAIRWRQLALEHGRAVVKPRGGDRHSGKIEAQGGFIRELIAEQGAMILTSNRGFAEWGEVFGDPVVANALLDRLLHHAVVVQIEGQATASDSMPN
ncbi:transposase (plasmid) [Hartmannibacter diazotrophicus]|uniref:Transposase n=1 Tax=Hartmannibacter diazotrophicus TaxID=1482074 RepID=A0A2C9DE45_9HYPH|nr:transposase [Hartmannibacter diazotrophicus]